MPLRRLTFVNDHERGKLIGNCQKKLLLDLFGDFAEISGKCQMFYKIGMPLIENSSHFFVLSKRNGQPFLGLSQYVFRTHPFHFTNACQRRLHNKVNNALSDGAFYRSLLHVLKKFRRQCFKLLRLKRKTHPSNKV